MVLFFAIILLIHYVDVNTQQYDKTSVENSMESNENNHTQEFDLLKLNNIFLDDIQYVQMLNDLHNPMPRRFRRDTKYPTNNNNSTNTRNKTNNNSNNIKKQQKNDSSMSASLITPTSTLSPVSRNKATTRKSFKTTSSNINKRLTTVPNKAPTTLALNSNNKNKVKVSEKNKANKFISFFHFDCYEYFLFFLFLSNF
jgi:hypothetical protein